MALLGESLELIGLNARSRPHAQFGNAEIHRIGVLLAGLQTGPVADRTHEFWFLHALILARFRQQKKGRLDDVPKKFTLYYFSIAYLLDAYAIGLLKERAFSAASAAVFSDETISTGAPPAL